ncbi:MAG: NADPH-dependent FMN reductase [Acidimicrobiales bacterium]
MNQPLNLVAIVGSLRAESFQRSIFNSADELAGSDIAISEVSLRDVPFFNEDLEVDGGPAAVQALNEAVDAADGLIVFTPEYNGSAPAVTKNAIDWLSRVPGDSALSRAAVGIVASSPGGHEVAGVRAHLGGSIGANTSRFYETTLGIASIADKLTDGRLTDEATRTRLAEWIAGFASHVRI